MRPVRPVRLVVPVVAGDGFWLRLLLQAATLSGNARRLQRVIHGLEACRQRVFDSQVIQIGRRHDHKFDHHVIAHLRARDCCVAGLERRLVNCVILPADQDTFVQGRNFLGRQVVLQVGAIVQTTVAGAARNEQFVRCVLYQVLDGHAQELRLVDVRLVHLQVAALQLAIHEHLVGVIAVQFSRRLHVLG